MAGLGRGLGSLISESNNKKARQQDPNASPLGKDLLERSRTSLPANKEAQPSSKSDKPSPKAKAPAKTKANTQAQAQTKSEANSEAKAQAQAQSAANAQTSSKEAAPKSTKTAKKSKATTKKEADKSLASTKTKAQSTASATATDTAKTQAKSKTSKAKVKASASDSNKEVAVEALQAKAQEPEPEAQALSTKAKRKASTPSQESQVIEGDNLQSSQDPKVTKSKSKAKGKAAPKAKASAKAKPKSKETATSSSNEPHAVSNAEHSSLEQHSEANSLQSSHETSSKSASTGTDTGASASASASAGLVSDRDKDSEVSYLAQDAALAQSMHDAMELSYLAENGLSDSSKASDIEVLSSISDDHLVLNVKLEMLMPSTYQPRHSFDDEAIRELATSIKEHGLLEPLIVKRIDGGKYEIICGERRYRAARMLNMASVPCLVREVVDEKAYAIALIENIQRENLNPVELAIAFDQMMQECGMTQEEVAKSVCKSRSAVANYLRVLKLEDGSLAALKAGKIDLGHAKVLLSLSGSAQNEACQIVIEKGLSVRATESFVKEFAKKLEDRAAEEAKNNPQSALGDANRTINYSAYEKSLNAKLKGVKAKFKSSKDGKGKLTFSYDNDRQLDSLLTLLGLVQED